jgi:hypothetical protein
MGLAAAACLVGLLLGELGLRLTGFMYFNFFYPDPVLGWVMRGGAQGTQTQEGNAPITINRYGFRDKEWNVEKPAGHFRIAVLGDSYTAGLQVPEEQRFTGILERELRSCDTLAGRRPEVLNFGVGRWGTAQALLCLRDRVLQFDPDMIVLAFFASNDLVDNSRQLEAGLEDKGSARARREGSGNFRPYFALQDGTLVLDDSFRDDPGFQRETTWWMKAFRSAVFSLRTAQLLARAMDGSGKASPRRSGQERAPAAAELVAERGLAPEVYSEPKTPAWDEAWRITEALLIEMAAEARRHGSSFSVMLVTSSSQVLPEAAERAHALGLDLLYPNRRLVDLGRRHGFPVLSLAEPFLAQAKADGSRFHGLGPNNRGVPWGGHWNALGHRAAGRLLATDVCGQLANRDGGSPGS